MKIHRSTYLASIHAATHVIRAGQIAILIAATSAPLCAASAPPWRDTPLARLEALALIQTLNAELLSSSSATRTLERWCQIHALAEPAQIVARRIDGTETTASEVIRQDLQVSAEEPVQYRRVELRCGEHVLSIADNWYVPARLTPEMNRSLTTTQTPFGKVVQPLLPHRETLAVKLLWSALPDGWELAPGRSAEQSSVSHGLEVPAALFEHRALLYAGAHQPIAEVHEVYQRDVLAFPEPQLPVR
jgi:chorismate-pyruvate lyase